MRVYNLTTKEHALSNLKNKRLKISKLDELNDPYELLGIQLPDKEIRKAFKNTRHELSLKYGLLCFSRFWINPVLWSHYGDKHYGIALGFDIPDDKLEEINYVPSLLSANYHSWFSEGAEALMNKLMRQKYIDWQYEQGRMVRTPSDPRSQNRVYRGRQSE